jgi:S-disulfanyl-L-cysteine oxidoreductase SoxD
MLYRFVVALTLAFAVSLSIAARRSLARSDTPLASHRSITTVWDSVYSVAQAARGESAYVKGCARCHGASLGGVDQSPPLAGSGFLGNWNGLPLSDLQDRIRTTMPPDSLGLYDRPFVTDVIAYVLKANGFPAGASDLSPEPERLKTITVQSAKP